MVPPIWADELWRPREKRPCPRCGREIPVLSILTEHPKWWGWQPWSVVEWCGHAQEVIPFPRADGLVAFVQVLGEVM